MPTFYSLAKENLSLLRKGIFRFKIQSSATSASGTQTTNLTGRINSNGPAYCRTTKTNLSLVPMSGFQYPSSYTEKVDCPGNIDLKADGVDMTLLNTLPKNLGAQISENGQISLQAEKATTEFAPSNVFLLKIIGIKYLKPHFSVCRFALK